VDIVVKGRNVEVPDHYRVHVAEKLHKVERYDQKVIRVDVELFHERNPRQSDHCQRVEITCASRGPVVRAEACAQDFYAALDCAITKLDARLRRAADRRRVHRGRRSPVSVAAATGGVPAHLVGHVGDAGPDEAPSATGSGRPIAAGTDSVTLDRPKRGTLIDEGTDRQGEGGGDETIEYDEPWRIVREKEHPGEPMTIDDALFQMELVGHDFYLFLDKESGRASAVYRRKGYDYGVISLAEFAA
jgi:ribosomal subunit interface protein